MTQVEANEFPALRARDRADLKRAEARQQYVSRRIGDLVAERQEENRKSGFVEDDRAALRAVLDENPELARDYNAPWR